MSLDPPEEPFRTKLAAVVAGEPASAEELLPLVYDELRSIAHAQRRMRFGADTLRTTALVHEAYLKLVGKHDPGWEGRAHFLAVAATAMRRVLSSYARDARAAKRGGAWRKVTLMDNASVKGTKGDDIDLVALDEALSQLAKVDARQSRIVELRYLSGMSVEETASVLSLSTRTVEREWRTARAWLSHEIGRKRKA